MPKGYSNKTGLPHSPPSGVGRVGWNKGLPKEKQPFFGVKHTPESIEKMRKYQLENRVESPYRFQKGHIAYNKSGLSKEEVARRAQKKWYSAHPEQIRENSRKANLKKYGLTIDDFDRMLQEQNGKCAVCFGLPSGRHNQFHVDHDHKTGKVRGLLCHFCNAALGMVRDNSDTLAALIKYLANT